MCQEKEPFIETFCLLNSALLLKTLLHRLIDIRTICIVWRILRSRKTHKEVVTSAMSIMYTVPLYCITTI